MGLNTTPSINNNSISANLIIPTHIAIEEHVTFVITVKSNDGAQRKVTQKDLSVNDTIFVDTVAPRIYLIGAKNHAVLINSTNPFIPGAVVVDGDPDHPRNHSITTNGTLNTFIINSVIIYTYTAEPDGAGNLGSSVTRTVIVKDKIPTKSSSSNSAPTLGKTSFGAQLVTNGFEYNGLAVNVGRYHTEFPLIGTNVGDINTIRMKIYDSAGPAGIKRVEFALGVYWIIPLSGRGFMIVVCPSISAVFLEPFVVQHIQMMQILGGCGQDRAICHMSHIRD